MKNVPLETIADAELESAYRAGDDHVHGLQLVFHLGLTQALNNLNLALAASPTQTQVPAATARVRQVVGSAQGQPAVVHVLKVVGETQQLTTKRG
jgi:hypothetical protein